jgi:hypothetical protein
MGKDGLAQRSARRALLICSWARSRGRAYHSQAKKALARAGVAGSPAKISTYSPNEPEVKMQTSLPLSGADFALAMLDARRFRMISTRECRFRLAIVDLPESGKGANTFRAGRSNLRG